MCCRLTNNRYCLTVGSLVGVAQMVIATPIMVLSLLVLLGSGLGHAVSPYWAACVVSRFCVCIIILIEMIAVMALMT